jgi:hypothetical protein
MCGTMSLSMRVSVTMVTEAVTDIMRMANPGGIVDQALAARIGGEIRPALEKVLTTKIGSGAELAALSEFRNILHQHLGNPKTAFVESETRRAMQRTLETANRTGSEFSSLVAHTGMRLLPWIAGESSRDDGEGRRVGERASAAALTRDTPVSVNGAISFAKELGISPSYAGLFAGGSQVMRDAWRDAITKGASIRDDQVKSMKDVGMVLGAIRGGKLAPDDPRIPESVKKIIGDMNAKGIDPASADKKVIQNYLKENPDALQKARKHDQADRNAASNLTPEGKKKQVETGSVKTKPVRKLDTTASL